MKNRRASPFPVLWSLKLCLYYMNRPGPLFFERKVTPPSTHTNPQVCRRGLFQTKHLLANAPTGMQMSQLHQLGSVLDNYSESAQINEEQ